MRCKAIQMSDQKVCRECGLVWDMNDRDPPDCKRTEETTVNYTRADHVPNAYRAAKDGC